MQDITSYSFHHTFFACMPILEGYLGTILTLRHHSMPPRKVNQKAGNKRHSRVTAFISGKCWAEFWKRVLGNSINLQGVSEIWTQFQSSKYFKLGPSF